MNTSGAGQIAGSTYLGSSIQTGSAQALQQQQPAAPDTLLRALSQMEGLNKRLADLSSHVETIAVAIGGPWPCDKAQGVNAPAPAQPPAIVLLNNHVDAAHMRVGAIEEAIAAIRRSLGA